MSLKGPPPSFAWDLLTCRAHIDFFTVYCEVKVPLPALDGKVNWVRDPQDKTSFNLSVHDPSRQDVIRVAEALENPVLVQLEIAVDFLPRPGLATTATEGILVRTFHSVAGRFRPEDATAWAYGMRGAVSRVGQKPEPFHVRYPSPDAQLIYGHRGEYMQSKAYLKRVDQHVQLPPEQQCVRTELAIRRGGLMTEQFALDRLGDLCGYSYRRTFARHFRFIDRPVVRNSNERSPALVDSLQKRMDRAWRQAGVGKFAPDLILPPDSSSTAVKRVEARAKQQLPRDDYVLRRDALTNRKVGTALRLLEKRMR